MHRVVIWTIGAGASCAAWLCGCNSSPVTPDFGSASPANRLASIQQAAEQQDVRKDSELIIELIRELTADDALVRLEAINALRKITGDDLGYRFDAPPAEQQAAINRWVAYATELSADDASTAASGTELPITSTTSDVSSLVGGCFR